MINVFCLFIYSLLIGLPLTTTATSDAENRAICDLASGIEGLSTIWVNCPTTNPCNWKGITCDTSNSIIGLSLSASDTAPSFLIGTLPTSIANLTNLQQLNLFVTKLSGNIPTYLGLLSKLQSLKLNSGGFTGPIPTELGNLAQLTLLDLGYNLLNGSIPTELGKLQILQSLNLPGNQLTGVIPTQVTVLSSLTELNLDYNKIQSLPPIQTNSFQNLQTLSIKVNGLTGPVPSGIVNLRQLVTLDLSHNSLTGALSSFQNDNLQTLIFSYNQLSGDLPSFEGTHIGTILLDHNLFTGPSTTSTKWYCPIMFNLDISFNNLTGFPVGLIGTVFTINLQNNQITAKIPDNLPLIDTLLLANNQITGTLPSTLHYTFLTTLDLSNNKITGSVPNTNQLNNVQTLLLNKNSLSGPIPDLSASTFLTTLHLENNQFDGTIGDNIFSNTLKLSELYLNDNDFSGAVPPSIGKLTALTALSLSNNNFSGIFPVINSPILTTMQISFEDKGVHLCAELSKYWQGNTWSSCDLGGLVYNCDVDPGPACYNQRQCNETVVCGLNQCDAGNSSCRDGRICHFIPPAGYLCTQNCDSNSEEIDGGYGCRKTDQYYEIVILIPIFGALLIIAVIGGVFWYKYNNYEYGINLPNDWFWDPHRIKESGYILNECSPPFYYKELKAESKQKEVSLFNSLKENLDFGDIIIIKCWSLVSLVLATTMSNAFSVQRARFISTPEKFCSFKAWQVKNRDHRQKVIDMFLQRCYNWDWNKNKEISQGLLLPMVHGTELSLAWKIASAGFATLSTLDAGFYGRGIYFSSSAMYTLPYFVNKRRPAVLICLTAPGNPYPIIESPNSKDNSMLGRPLISGFQSHYVVTGANGFPPSEKKLDRIKKYDELVLSQEVQVVPMFLVEIDTSNFSYLLTVFTSKKTAIDRSMDDTEEHRSIDYHLSGGEERSGEERSTLRNASSPAKNQSQTRRFDQSGQATLQSQSRKTDQSQRRFDQSHPRNATTTTPANDKQ